MTAHRPHNPAIVQFKSGIRDQVILPGVRIKRLVETFRTENNVELTTYQLIVE